MCFDKVVANVLGIAEGGVFSTIVYKKYECSNLVQKFLNMHISPAFGNTLLAAVLLSARNSSHQCFKRSIFKFLCPLFAKVETKNKVNNRK